MAEQKTEECPHCKSKDTELVQVKAALTAANERGDKAETAIKELSEGDRLPTVRDFILHCEGGNCGHAQEWQVVKAGIIQQTIDKLPLDVVTAKAEALGILPKEIIIRNIESILGRR